MYKNFPNQFASHLISEQRPWIINNVLTKTRKSTFVAWAECVIGACWAGREGVAILTCLDGVMGGHKYHLIWVTGEKPVHNGEQSWKPCGGQSYFPVMVFSCFVGEWRRVLFWARLETAPVRTEPLSQGAELQSMPGQSLTVWKVGVCALNLLWLTDKIFLCSWRVTFTRWH